MTSGGFYVGDCINHLPQIRSTVTNKQGVVAICIVFVSECQQIARGTAIANRMASYLYSY
jgi:hypothetical protein